MLIKYRFLLLRSNTAYLTSMFIASICLSNFNILIASVSRSVGRNVCKKYIS